MSNSNKGLILIMLTIALTLVGCNRKTVFSHYEHVELDGWEQADTLFFKIAGIPAGTYEEELGIRNSVEYPYMQLTVVAYQQSVSGMQRTDTLEVDMANRAGKLTGTGISRYYHALPLGQVTLSDSDTLYVRVHHYMINNDLPGISDIGVTLKKLK